MNEDQDLQHKIDAMTAFQREQLMSHIAGYRKTLLMKKPPIDLQSIDVMVRQFKRTLIIQIAKRAPAVTKPVNAPPPKPHPLSVQGPIPTVLAAPSKPVQVKPAPKPEVPTMQIAIGGRVHTVPVSLKEWIVRLYQSLPVGDVGARIKADKHVEQLVAKAINSGAVMTTDWRYFPIPEFPKTEAAAAEFIPVIDRLPMKKKSEPNKKTRKTATVTPAAAEELGLSSEELSRRRARAEKYHAHLQDMSTSSTSETLKAQVHYEFGDDAEDVFLKTGQYAVVGTCRLLEKAYFRLTSAPDPQLVRPPEILAAHMKNLEICARQKIRDYKWLSDQVRAVRQDLTVQGVKGGLAAAVYEWNARLALENEDIGQFNQCQTQIKELHAAPFQLCGFVSSAQSRLDTQAEFLAYSLIYFTLQGMRVDQQRFLVKWMTLPLELKRHGFVEFAFQIRQAVALGDFPSLFRLYRVSSDAERTVVTRRSPKKVKTATRPPSHAHHLMKPFISGLRLEAISQLTKAFMTLQAGWLAAYLGMESETQLREFMHEEFFVWKSELTLDCKATLSKLKDHPQLASRKLAQMG